MQIDTNILKTIAKQGLKVVLTIFGITALGVVLNWVLLAFLIPELKILFDTSGGMGGHGGGGAAILTVLLLFVFNWKATLLFLTFFLVFPVLHFIFAKKYAVTNAIQSLLAERKTQLVEYLMQKFFERLNTKMEWLDKLNSSNLVTSVNEYLPIYIKKLEGMPFVVRGIIKLFLSRLDFLGIVSSTLSEEGKIDISQQELIQKISNKVNLVLDEKVFSASFQFNLIIFTLNILSFSLAKIFIQ